MNEHGGNIFINDAEYDFSANLNPLGMPVSVKKAVLDNWDLWERYPDPDCTELRKNISEYEAVPAENIVCGNGAADLIYRLVQAIHPQKAVIPVPTFSEYKKALTEYGSTVNEYPMNYDYLALNEDFLDKLAENVDMVFICHPNNPTGMCISAELLGKLAERCLKNKIYLVCDESFLGFVENGFSIKSFLNDYVIVLKAFTKMYAMPGLRLGYALFGSSELAAKVHKTGQFWSVSAPAQIAGIAALKESGYQEKTRELITREREYLQEQLSEMHLMYYPSQANFILFRAEKGLETALLKEKILIRCCGNYTGLDQSYYRIAIRTHEENEILVSALRRCING